MFAPQTSTDNRPPATDDDLYRTAAAGVLNGPSTWWADARCRDGGASLTRLFFSEELHDIAAAKGICAECPVLAQCLEGAIDRREPWGVWGGQLFLNGKALAGKRRRGRPPKIPRPGDQLPDVPVPEHLVDRLEIRTA